MKREIVIRPTVHRWLKRRWQIAVAVAIVGGGALAYAKVPNSFNAGDVLSAQKLDDDFNALVDLTSNQTVAGTKTWTSGTIASGGNGVPYYLVEGGPAYNDSMVTIDQTAVGGYAGLLLKGNTVANDYGNVGFSLQNSNGHSVIGARIEGAITSAGAGSESADLTFATKPASRGVREVMRLTSGGNVGIGTTAAPDLVTIVSQTGWGERITVSSDNSYLRLSSNQVSAFTGFDGPNALLLNLNGGNVGIGTLRPMYALDVNGTIRGTNVSPSDARLKTNVRTIEHALDDLERLRGVRFDWKKDHAHSIGVIAQEVERVYPELVVTAGDGMKSVDYAKLTAVLIEAAKEEHRRVQRLEEARSKLEADNARLRERLDGIERAVAKLADGSHGSRVASE